MLLRKAVGRLVASPLFTAFAVLSLAAGVAVTTAVYSVVDTFLLRRVEARDPESLVFVMSPRAGTIRRAAVSLEDLDAVRRAQRSLERIAGSSSVFAEVESTRNVEFLPVEAVDAAYFPTVGIGARIGRLIEERDQHAAARVAVVSDAFWRSRFAGDPGATDRAITINGQAFDVVGVISGRYAGLDGRGFGTQVWVPLSALPARRDALAPNLGPPDETTLTVVGRVRSPRDLQAASVEIATIASQLDASRPLPVLAAGAPPRQRQWSVGSALDLSDEDDDMGRAGIVLVVLVGLVLVVACTNLANLVLARGTARQGELAVRMAMGASRGRLVWEQSIESLLLSMMGAVASYAMFIAVSAWMTQDFTFVVPPMGRVTLSIRPEISGAALLVSLGSLLLSLAVFGLEPAVQLARSLDIRTVLAVGATGVRPRVARQRMIVRWQVAVAAGFFIVATMFIRATVAQARHDPGIDIDRVALATLGVNAKGTDSARLRRAVDRVLLEAAATGAVESVAASTGLPFGIQPALRAGIARPGSGSDREPMAAPAIAATPSLFRVLGIPILSGRGFNDTDGVAAARVAVISETAAKQLFPGADSIGQPVVLTIGRDRSAATIVGISRDTDVRALNRPRQPLLYVPLTQHFDRNIVISARPTGRMTSAVAALRRAVQAADPDLRVDISGGARAILSGPLEIFRSAGRGALYLGGFTLLLSMAGLFGVQSHVVAYRTREFGVRMSLGASARQIKTMVIRDGARPVFDGLVLGLWGGIAGRFMVRGYTDIEVAVLDSWMLAVAPVPIVLAALFACYLPASRASRVDPTTALRCE